MEAVAQFIDHIYSPEMQKLMAEFGSLRCGAMWPRKALEGLDDRYGVATDAMAQAARRPPWSTTTSTTRRPDRGCSSCRKRSMATT